jgi:hypothetical protein
MAMSSPNRSSTRRSAPPLTRAPSSTPRPATMKVGRCILHNKRGSPPRGRPRRAGRGRPRDKRGVAPPAADFRQRVARGERGCRLHHVHVALPPRVFHQQLSKKVCSALLIKPRGRCRKNTNSHHHPRAKTTVARHLPAPSLLAAPRKLPATVVSRPWLGCRRFLLQPPGPTRCCRSRAYRLAGAAPGRRQRRPGGIPCWERTASSAGLGGGITLGKQQKEGQVLGSAGRSRLSVIRLVVLVPQRVRGLGRDLSEEGH